jgi:hypothetical protein
MASTAFGHARALERNRRVPAEDLDRIASALSGLCFGAVTVIVQDGVVVQVERTEKVRLARVGGSESR